MAVDFKAIGEYETVLATIATAVVIEAGDLVAIDTGLIIKAVAASPEIAFAVTASPLGSTQIEVTNGRVQLIGTGDAAFAVSQKGTEVDIVGTTTQLIDVGESSTNVLRISTKEDAGTVDALTNIKVEINKPINF